MKQSFMTIGIGGTLEIPINDKIALQLYGGALPRVELKMMYDADKIVVSWFAKFVYKIHL